VTKIKFGTDGWRAVIAEDFTEDNVRIVAHAAARYVVRVEQPAHGVIVGYDTRFGSERFARVAAETIAATGTPVWLSDRACPTPGDFPPGEAAQRRRRNSNHRQPQSGALERRQVQGHLRQLGISRDRRADRRHNSQSP
jgi:hypothetical protein